MKLYKNNKSTDHDHIHDIYDKIDNLRKTLQKVKSQKSEWSQYCANEIDEFSDSMDRLYDAMKDFDYEHHI